MPRLRSLALPRPSLVFDLLGDREASRWKKVVLLLAVLYVVFPIDLVPDLVPLWGWLDDAGVFTVAIAFLSWAVAPYRNRQLENEKQRSNSAMPSSGSTATTSQT